MTKLGLADHGDWAQATKAGRGPVKLNEALASLDDDDRELLLSWLHDPANWPNNRIARALQQMAREEGKPELMVYHSNVNTWRIHNQIRQGDD